MLKALELREDRLARWVRQPHAALKLGSSPEHLGEARFRGNSLARVVRRGDHQLADDLSGADEALVGAPPGRCSSAADDALVGDPAAMRISEEDSAGLGDPDRIGCRRDPGSEEDHSGDGNRRKNMHSKLQTLALAGTIQPKKRICRV